MDTNTAAMVRQMREALQRIDNAIDRDDWAGDDRMMDITGPAIAAADQWLAQQSGPLTDAALDVLAERRRQAEVEGWTPEHDDQHRTGGMAVAAACYAAWSMPSRAASEAVAGMWPWTGWATKWFKPKDTRHNLVRAAALLLAEIERLDRSNGIGQPAGEDTPC